MKIKYYNFVIALFVFISIALFYCGNHACANDVPDNEYIKKVDVLFQEWNKPDSPGCVVAIIKDGRIFYKHAYGMADLEHNIPLTTTSVFDVGSMSKQFTAFAIALLEQQGKLSV